MPSRRLILNYPPDVVQEPVTYQLVKDYDLKINILKARILPREGGRLVMELSGLKESLESALSYLSSLGIEVKTLVREVRQDKDKCLSCTACVRSAPPEPCTWRKGGMRWSWITTNASSARPASRPAPTGP